MTKSSSFELTTSRISRLLRPLRLKCTALATLTVHPSHLKSHVLVTYPGRHIFSHSANEQPLVVIPPPDKLRVFSHLDKTSRANIQLSKLLYDIRDAFKNVLQAAGLQCASRRKLAGDSCSGDSRIRRLTALCAAVLGQHLEEQVELSKAEKEQEDACEHDDLLVLGEYYEAVPEHHRRHTIISHALSIIFSTCPLNHTLYFILLEVTSSYGLKVESEAVLGRLLETVLVAVEVPPSESALSYTASLLSRSAHAHYLKSLCIRLSEPRVVDDRAFTRILCHAISKVPPTLRPDIWTSKAMVRLARSFRAGNYDTFVSLCTGLVRDVADLPPSPKGKERELSAAAEVRDRLAKWLETVCEYLISTSDADLHVLQAIADLLSIAQAAGLHSYRDDSDASKAISDALLCLAILCLSSPHSSTFSSHCVTPLASIMYEYHGANVDTFNSITSICLINITKDDANDYLQMAAEVKSSFTALRHQANLLHSKRLFLLEAWLWSNVLAHIESLTPEIGTHYDTALHRSAFVDELERLRRDTVKKIEGAERLHFASHSSVASTNSTHHDQTPSKAASAARGSEFRWEELVGCWVLKTPLPVKRRRPPKRPSPDVADEDEEENFLDQHVAKRPRIFETPLRPRALSVASSTSMSSQTSPQSSTEMPISSSHIATRMDEQENVEGEVPLPRLNFVKGKADRRRSAFTSLLADARANRVVLHPKADDDDTEDTVGRSSPVCSRLGESQTDRAPSKSSTTRPRRDLCDSHEPSSDDLDLFAYRSSEW